MRLFWKGPYVHFIKTVAGLLYGFANSVCDRVYDQGEADLAKRWLRA
jgi:hypothetical protein